VAPGDQDELGVEAVVCDLLGGHQRQLVQRQRPPRERRRDERDPAHVALLEFVEQASHGCGAVRTAELDRVVEGGQNAGPGRQDERAVAPRVSIALDDAPLVGVDRDHGSPHQVSAEVGGDLAQRVAPRCAEAERFGDRHGPVDEIAVRRDERDAYALARQRAERHQRLQQRHRHPR
jgi:hypothetical protein